MAHNRPTFHESWYRVVDLAPRLLSGVHVHRQHFRGRLWYVLENPANNQFSRISPPAYKFLAHLDGKRKVGDAWHICNEKLGDDAPTQGEVIQLLGQLFTANLLYAELPPDSESLLSRYQKRVKRQVQGYLTNLLFIRVPLIDPDHFLNRWVNIFGLAFTKIGFILWLAMISTGLYFVISNAKELIHQGRDVLNPENIILLYLTFSVVKIIHEFSHAFACKKFGQHNHNNGQVHTMGIMFLVFVPVPFLDASSAWSFRSKWHRVVTGSAGVLAELFMASIAAIVWSFTSTGTIHIIAYNVIFVASVSSLLFNGNPLLRFDAYYVLADLIEIPNLGQRSKDYLYYLVKRYCWGMKNALVNAHTTGERIWFVFFGIASSLYRIFISVRILLFLNNRLPEELFILVPILAISAVIMWVFVPIGKLIRYIATSLDLARNRPRAVTTSIVFVVTLIVLLGIIPLPDHIRVEGIAEPVELAIVHVETDGFVESSHPTNTSVTPDSEPLLKLTNPLLQAQKKTLTAERRDLEVRWRLAQLNETAAAQILREQIDALEEKIARIDERIAKLNLAAPISGTWISPEIEKAEGAYLRQGQQIGFIGSIDDMRIRATAPQALAALLVADQDNIKNLEVRIKKCPDTTVTGKIVQIYPSGHQSLPSQALGYMAGGSMPTDLRDDRGTRSAEKFFEIRIKPDPKENFDFLTGQRTIVRIQLPSKPIGFQWYRSIRQLFQRRFHI